MESQLRPDQRDCEAVMTAGRKPATSAQDARFNQDPTQMERAHEGAGTQGCRAAASFNLNNERNIAQPVVVSAMAEARSCCQKPRVHPLLHVHPSVREAQTTVQTTGRAARTINQLAAVCGGCEEPSCQSLLTSCEVDCISDDDCTGTDQRCVLGTCLREGTARFTLVWSAQAPL
jgi:hypothetical protein